MTAQQVIDTRFELSLSGPLDAQEIQKLRPDLDFLAHSHYSPLVLNMAAVDFLDASGVGAIVYLYKRLTQAGHQLEITHVHGQPLTLIRALRIDRTLSVTAD